MTYILSNLLRDAASHIGNLKYARATGGSTTTAISTTHPAGQKDADWKNGTLIVLRDAGGASAAPEGQFSRITAYSPTPSAPTWTVADTLTSAIASGDRIGLISPTFHHDELIELANDALRQLGDVPFMDTSITTANNQTEYTLPVALKQYTPQRVSVQGITTDANDNRWVDLAYWDYTFTNPASTALLILPQLPADRTIRIMYLGQHPAVNAYSDTISEYVHPVLARASMVERMANRITTSSQNAVPEFRFGYDKAIKEFEDAKEAYPINKPHRQQRHTIIGRDYARGFTPNIANL